MAGIQRYFWDFKSTSREHCTVLLKVAWRMTALPPGIRWNIQCLFLENLTHAASNFFPVATSKYAMLVLSQVSFWHGPRLCIPDIINLWIRTETYWVIPEIVTASYNVNKKLTPSNVWENWDILTSTSNQKHGPKAALWRQAICFTLNVQYSLVSVFSGLYTPESI